MQKPIFPWKRILSISRLSKSACEVVRAYSHARTRTAHIIYIYVSPQYKTPHLFHEKSDCFLIVLLCTHTDRKVHAKSQQLVSRLREVDSKLVLTYSCSLERMRVRFSVYLCVHVCMYVCKSRVRVVCVLLSDQLRDSYCEYTNKALLISDSIYIPFASLRDSICPFTPLFQLAFVYWCLS